MRKSKRQSTPATRQEIVLGVLLLFGVFGIPAGFAGAFAIPQMANELLGLELLWWQGLIAGIVLGVVIPGAVLIFSKIKKLARYDRDHPQNAPIKAPNLALEKSIGDSIRLLSGSSNEICFDLSDSKKVNNSKVSLGELTITRYSEEHGHRSTSRDATQTVVFFENPDLNLPEFSLRPQKSNSFFVSNLFTGVEASLEEFPEFSSHYRLAGLEARLKKLFTSELAALLTRQPIWEIHAYKDRMILFVPGQVYQGENRDRFLRRGIKIALAFEQHCTALKQGHDFNQPVTSEEIKAQAEKNIGLLGMLFQQDFSKRFISLEEVGKFISQTRPRVVPKPLQHQTGPDFFLLLVGIICIGFSVVVFLFSQAERENMFFLGLISGAFFLAGGLLIFLATFFSRRKRAILRNGLATPGEITKVESTDWVNGEKRMYRCHVKFFHGSTKMATFCWIDQLLAKKAQAIIDEQRPTQVLISPSNPKRCLLPELMATA